MQRRSQKKIHGEKNGGVTSKGAENDRLQDLNV